MIYLSEVILVLLLGWKHPFPPPDLLRKAKRAGILSPRTKSLGFEFSYSSASAGLETPVPIPNTEVKQPKADGSMSYGMQE